MAELDLEACRKVEQRYLDKINDQQNKIRMMKKILDQQALKNVEIHRRGTHLQRKLRYFISNDKIKESDMKDLKEDGLLDEETCQVMEKWLELNDGKEFVQVGKVLLSILERLRTFSIIS